MQPIVRRQWRLSLGLGVVLAAASAGASTAALPAQAAPTVAGGTVLRLPEPPPTLSVPADGRLDGYGFAGTVLGVATARVVDGQQAGAGRQWWVFEMRWQVTPVDPPAAVSLAVVADAQTVALPLPAGAASSPDTGPLYWAVAEPTAAPDVTVQATSQDFTQSFSLARLRRSGPAPAVLYRTPGDWQTVVTVNRTVTRHIPDFAGGASGGLAIDLQAVTVTDFGPAGPNDTPPAGTGAWITLTISSTNNPNDRTFFYHGLTAGQITLTVPGHTPIDATITAGGGLDGYSGLDSGNNGVFPDRYAFPVPAAITAATLTIPPTHLSVGSSAYPLATVNVAPATFTVTFPVPTIPVAPAVLAVAPRHYDTIGAAPARPPSTARPAGAQGRTTNPVALLIALLGALAIVAAVAAIVIRSRRSPRPTAPIAAWTTPPADSTESRRPSTEAQNHQPPPEAPTSDFEPQRNRQGADGGRVTAATKTTRPDIGSGLAGRVGTSAPRVRTPVTATSPQPARPAVGVLGPVTVEGWVGERPRRAAVVDLIVYLACHPERPVSADVLRAALSGPDADLSEDTLRTYASHARRALGADHLPPAGDRGYRLVDVDVDWTTFQALVADAAAGPDDQGRTLLGQALRLVRGRALPEPARWADLENLPAVIDRTVSDTAARLAGLHLDAGDPAAAYAAAEVGLDITPTDRACAVAALNAAAPTGRLAPTWQRIARAWADNDIALPPELIDLRRRLATPV
jgi:hypothetical protein